MNFKRFAQFVTLLILGYLLLRAAFTEFIVDEAVSYHYYAYKGRFYGENIHWDAANHPLNSLLGHLMFKVFGDLYLTLRMFSLLSFLLYAWSAYQLCKGFSRKSLVYLSFLSLVSIPYLLEYFAYFRGYGLSMGPYLASIYFMIRFFKDKKVKYLGSCYLFLVIALSANLTLINSVVLLMFGAILFQIVGYKTFKLKAHILLFVINIGMVMATFPFVRFAFDLKENGCLYYAALDGFWDITAVSLIEVVFFKSHNHLMYAFIALFIVLSYISLKKWITYGFIKWAELDWSVYLYLFLGNFVASVVLAELLAVNYPMDRTGMYFIPIFLLLLFQLLERLKWSEYLLIYFPISLFSNLSLHGSVYTPEQRLTSAFFDKVNKFIKPNYTIGGFPTLVPNWEFLSSKSKEKKSVLLKGFEESKKVDVLILQGITPIYSDFYNPYLKKYYKVIARDNITKHVAYLRKTRIPKTLVYSKSNLLKRGDSEFINIIETVVLDSLEINSLFTVNITGNLDIESKSNDTQLVVSVTNNKGAILSYQTVDFDIIFQNQFVKNRIVHNFIVENLNDNEINISVYLWNHKVGVLHTLKNANVSIFELKMN
jgi:hypothetical protein